MPAKQRIVLLVLLLFGLPAVVTTALLTTSVKHVVHDGPQPGGVLHGVVRDEQKHALANIEVSAFSVDASASQTALIGTTRTDAEGAFVASLPSVRGHYELRVRGAQWQESRIDYGWLDPSGRPFDPGAIEVTLRPGSSLEVDLVRTDTRPAGPGSFELEGVPTAGFFASFSAVPVQREGSFATGSFTIEGLPPMHGHLMIRMGTGERVDSTLDLSLGKNHHKVEL